MEHNILKELLDCIECPVELQPGQIYLRKGLVAKMNGFEFRVYSNDHDKHFHVIHLDRGINARFSFPEIKLINYKNLGNTISSREEKNIIVFFKNKGYFEKLEEEFKKRDN